MFWHLLLLLSFFVHKNDALLPTIGLCPDVDVIESLNTSDFLGKWYEAERYLSLNEFGTKCVTFNYTKNENGSLKLVNSQISLLTGIESTIEGVMRPIERADDPKFVVSYPTFPFQYPIAHWVLATDYKEYTVLWSCTNMGVISMKSAWILTRERQPPVSVLEKAYRILDKNNISRAYFYRTDQRNCKNQTK